MLHTLSTQPTQLVTALPNAEHWLASQSGELVRGGGPGEEVANLTPSQKTEEPVLRPTALLGMDSGIAMLAFPFATSVLRLGDADLTVFPLEKLPGAPGMLTSMKAHPDVGCFLACGNRLSLVVPPKPLTITEGQGFSFAEHFTALAVSPERKLAVGRGDGTIELRDPATLARLVVFHIGDHDAPLALHFVTPNLLAVATDDRKLGFLDLKTQQYTLVERAVEVVATPSGPVIRGGGKVIDIVPLANGRYAAIGLSRTVGVFEGTREILTGAFDDQLGDTKLSSAAAIDFGGDEYLLLAGSAGLHAVRTAALKRVESTETAASPASEGDVPEHLIAALRSGDEQRQLDAFFSANSRRMFLGPIVREALASAQEPLRYYAADHYAYMSQGVHERAFELRETLKDPSARVVAAAVASLGVIGNPAAVEWVAPLITDARLSVAFTAVQALLKLRGRQAAESISQAIAGGSGVLSLTLSTLHPDLAVFISLPIGMDVPAHASLEQIRSVIAERFTLSFHARIDERKALDYGLKSSYQLSSALVPILQETKGCLSFDGGCFQVVDAEEGALYWQRWIHEGHFEAALRAQTAL